MKENIKYDPEKYCLSHKKKNRALKNHENQGKPEKQNTKK